MGVFLPFCHGSAPPPSAGICETLSFEAIVDDCSTITMPSSMESVNVVTNPAHIKRKSQGAQINGGYCSYIKESCNVDPGATVRRHKKSCSPTISLIALEISGNRDDDRSWLVDVESRTLYSGERPLAA